MYQDIVIMLCPNCREPIRQGDWDFDENEREPICPNCGEFLNLPDGY